MSYARSLQLFLLIRLSPELAARNFIHTNAPLNCDSIRSAYTQHNRLEEVQSGLSEFATFVMVVVHFCFCFGICQLVEANESTQHTKATADDHSTKTKNFVSDREILREGERACVREGSEKLKSCFYH